MNIIVHSFCLCNAVIFGNCGLGPIRLRTNSETMNRLYIRYDPSDGGLAHRKFSVFTGYNNTERCVPPNSMRDSRPVIPVFEGSKILDLLWPAIISLLANLLITFSDNVRTPNADPSFPDTVSYQILFVQLLLCSKLSIATRLRDGRPGFDSQQGWKYSSLPLRPDRLRGSPTLLYNGYRGLFRRG